MNIGSLVDSLNDVKRILQEANILKEENNSRRKSFLFSKFSEEFIQVSQSEDYERIYKVAMSNSDYDFLLKDDSFVQFSCRPNNGSIEEGSIRYAFYPNPRHYITYEEFLLELGFSYDECGDELINDYEQEIFESKLKETVTPIRYDYDFKLYKPVRHPISHLHIGFEENLRIPVSKIIYPQKFIVFIIKNMYFDEWKKVYKNNDLYKELSIDAKNKCLNLDSDFFSDEEQKFLYIF